MGLVVRAKARLLHTQRGCSGGVHGFVCKPCEGNGQGTDLCSSPPRRNCYFFFGQNQEFEHCQFHLLDLYTPSPTRGKEQRVANVEARLPAFLFSLHLPEAKLQAARPRHQCLTKCQALERKDPLWESNLKADETSEPPKTCKT